MTAYDMAPTHGILFSIASGLSIRKTIHAMCAQAATHRAAVINNEGECGLSRGGPLQTAATTCSRCPTSWAVSRSGG